MLQASRISRALRFRTEQAIRAFATSNESGEPAGGDGWPAKGWAIPPGFSISGGALGSSEWPGSHTPNVMRRSFGSRGSEEDPAEASGPGRSAPHVCRAVEPYGGGAARMCALRCNVTSIRSCRRKGIRSCSVSGGGTGRGCGMVLVSGLPTSVPNLRSPLNPRYHTTLPEARRREEQAAHEADAAADAEDPGGRHQAPGRLHHQEVLQAVWVPAGGVGGHA